MKTCPDDRRRRDYLDAAQQYVEEQGVEVKRGGGYRYAFSLKKWRNIPADNGRYPGFYVYCSNHAERPEHRDLLCFDLPREWVFGGDMDALLLRRVGSYWRAKTHDYLELQTKHGNLVNPSISLFKPEVGDRIVKIFQVLEESEPVSV
jgi:hypothetical protein